MRDQLFRRRHVDAVHIGKAHGRRSRGEIHLVGAGFARHLDNLLAGGAAHDQIVHQQYILALEFEPDRIELLPHRFLALILSRHDEGAADVAILHQTFTKLNAQTLCQRLTGNAARIRNRDDDVDIVIGAQPLNVFGEFFALAQARLVLGYSIYDRFGACEIHMHENTGGGAWGLAALLGGYDTSGGDVDGSARLYIALQPEAQ